MLFPPGPLCISPVAQRVLFQNPNLIIVGFQFCFKGVDLGIPLLQQLQNFFSLPFGIQRPDLLQLGADLFHFGWNMAHYFGQPKQDVVPWLKAVFVPLSDLEDSYIKGKLRDYQTEKYTIPNIEDIPKYMAEHNG